jgi:hypothetical protein
MRLTFQSNLAANKVNEKSSFDLTVKFWDDSADTWAALTPTSLRYRIDDVQRGTEQLAWTNLTAAASNTISVPASANAILNGMNKRETKVLTVQANNGLTNQYAGTFYYTVENVLGIT